MTNKPPRDQFEELAIPRKELPKLSSCYRIYTDAKNYVSVEADNALEALKKSGLQQVYRIERDSIFLNAVLDIDKMSNNPAPAASAAVPPSPETPAPAPLPPEAQAQPAAPPPAEPAPEAPLSSADVDKLLKGEGATGA